MHKNKHKNTNYWFVFSEKYSDCLELIAYFLVEHKYLLFPFLHYEKIFLNLYPAQAVVSI